MEIRDSENLCIIAPLCSTIDKRKTLQILKEIENEKRELAIDLAYTNDCTFDFIEFLKNTKFNSISIFNIPSNIFVLFNIMNIDKNIKIFVSETDFLSNSRQIINRRFAVL